MVRQLLRALTARSAQAADRAAATPAHDEAGSTEPVDASARRPAARDRPARQAATVHDTDPPGVDTGTDADTPGVVSVERPWQERGEELERWWAEMGRQVLAEVAARPERGPEGPPDAPPHEERRVLAGLDGVPERGPVGPRSDPPDLAEWAPIDGEPAHADPPPDAPAPLARLPGPVSHGWWAAADRAVDDAGAAVDRTRTALGHARRLVRTAGAADAADESTWAAGPAGRASAAEDALAALAAAADEQRDELAWLLSATAEGGLADRPRVALTDAVTGALIALTDLPGLRRAGHCGAAPCRRDPENCVHDLTGRPGLGAPVPTPRTGPAPNSTGGCGRGTGAVASQAAAVGCPGAASSTTTQALAGGRHQRREPGRLLHRRSPGQAPGSRLAARPRPRRHAHRHHTGRSDRSHDPTALLNARSGLIGGVAQRGVCWWTASRQPSSRRT